jgi:hypothetical protein
VYLLVSRQELRHICISQGELTIFHRCSCANAYVLGLGDAPPVRQCRVSKRNRACDSNSIVVIVHQSRE